MSKHQNRAKQTYNQSLGAVPAYREKMPHKAAEPMPSEDIQGKTAVDESSIQSRAYQIHREKGGAALDNWLEAERSLRNNDASVSGFINEGNPNTQK